MATHTIKSGDTPWSLAVKYVGAGARWKELCAENPQLPKHATYGCVFTVGKVITLPSSWVPEEKVAEPPLYAVVPAVNPTVSPPVQPQTVSTVNTTIVSPKLVTNTQPSQPVILEKEPESIIPGLPGKMFGVDTNYLLMGVAGLALIGLAVVTTGGKPAPKPAAAAPSSPAMAKNGRRGRKYRPRKSRKVRATKRSRKRTRKSNRRAR